MGVFTILWIHFNFNNPIIEIDSYSHYQLFINYFTELFAKYY